MKIALLSCTSRKKDYPCPAAEMYSESQRFSLAYQYAKMICDQVFILSAKFGLVNEVAIIKPYNVTLNNMSGSERAVWYKKVLTEMNNIFSLDNDEFTILAGDIYCAGLLPNIKNYTRPLKGKRLGFWIPTLRHLIGDSNMLLNSYEEQCLHLHTFFNQLPRFSWSDINHMSILNGIYIVFEKDERYKNLDRIVRVGTHKADGRLKERLKDHFIRKNKDGSIFRKNIGLALLHMNNDPYEEIWNEDKLAGDIRCLEIEEQVSEYMQNHFSFSCFEINIREERLKLEEGIIALLNRSGDFTSSDTWLGKNSPKKCIANSGLWNTQGLNSEVLTTTEFNRIILLVKGEGLQPVEIKVRRAEKEEQEEIILSRSGNGSKVDRVRDYINQKLTKGKESGFEYLDVVSGDIHRELNLENAMPTVCRAMEKLREVGDEVLRTTSSGKSSTIEYRYYLRNR